MAGMTVRPCGSWGGCTLPYGHNLGKADVPENHRPPNKKIFTVLSDGRTVQITEVPGRAIVAFNGPKGVAGIGHIDVTGFTMTHPMTLDKEALSAVHGLVMEYWENGLDGRPVGYKPVRDGGL